MRETTKLKLDKTLAYVNKNRGTICYAVGVGVGFVATGYVFQVELNKLALSKARLLGEFNEVYYDAGLKTEFIDAKGLRDEFFAFAKFDDEKFEAAVEAAGGDVKKALKALRN